MSHIPMNKRPLQQKSKWSNFGAILFSNLYLVCMFLMEFSDFFSKFYFVYMFLIKTQQFHNFFKFSRNTYD